MLKFDFLSAAVKEKDTGKHPGHVYHDIKHEGSQVYANATKPLKYELYN